MSGFYNPQRLPSINLCGEEETVKQLIILVCVALVATPVCGATLDDLSWMAGHWRSESGDSASEELWMAPEGSLMIGLHRDIRPGKRAFFEFLRIESRDEIITYVAQPGGKAPTMFPLKSVEEARVTFENPDHDFPQRIIYWLEGDALCARIEGTMDGKDASDQWCWARQ